MPLYLVAAGASRPDCLAVVPPTEQLLIGPEVDQVYQFLATLGAHEAGRVPKGAVVTCSLSVNSRSLFGNGLLTPSAVLEDEGRRRRASETH